MTLFELGLPVEAPSPGARMSLEEFDWWRAYDTFVRPLGDQRLARQSALIACLLANINDRSKHEPWTLDDFDLYLPRVPLTRAEEEERFRAEWESRGLVVVKAEVTDHGA